VCAVPLVRAGERLGGLLTYLDEAAEPGDRASLDLALELAAVVAEALVAVRPRAEWPAEDAPADHPGQDDERCVLPPDATAPSVARHWVRSVLEGQRLERSLVDAALVCTSELVTNVVIHTGRPSVVSLEREGPEVVLRIRHLTAPSPPRIMVDQALDPLRVSGHGLELVDALSTEWGSEVRDGVTTAWCRLRVS
jgi:hypothetical protein